MKKILIVILSFVLCLFCVGCSFRIEPFKESPVLKANADTLDTIGDSAFNFLIIPEGTSLERTDPTDSSGGVSENDVWILSVYSMDTGETLSMSVSFDGDDYNTLSCNIYEVSVDITNDFYFRIYPSWNNGDYEIRLSKIEGVPMYIGYGTFDTYTESFNSGGSDAGYDAGYMVGYEEGYNSGYNDGHIAGYDKAMSEEDILQDVIPDFVFAIFDAPIAVLRDAFSFEVFGINVAGLLMFILTGLVVIFVIRRFR